MEDGATKSGTTMRVPEPSAGPSPSPAYLPGPHTHARGHTHSRNSSLDMRVGSRSSNDIRSGAGRGCHSRAASLDLRHTRNSSADLNKLIRNDLGLVFGGNQSKFRYNSRTCAILFVLNVKALKSVSNIIYINTLL